MLLAEDGKSAGKQVLTYADQGAGARAWLLIRREYLDRLFFWNSVDLMRKLDAFRDYYNVFRVHRSLDGTMPAQCAGMVPPASAVLSSYVWRQHCHGLFHTPMAA